MQQKSGTFGFAKPTQNAVTLAHLTKNLDAMLSWSLWNACLWASERWLKLPVEFEHFRGSKKVINEVLKKKVLWSKRKGGHSWWKKIAAEDYFLLNYTLKRCDVSTSKNVKTICIYSNVFSAFDIAPQFYTRCSWTVQLCTLVVNRDNFNKFI